MKVSSQKLDVYKTIGICCKFKKMALLRMQSLVDAAGEALGIIEDPMLTDIGLKVVQFVRIRET